MKLLHILLFLVYLKFSTNSERKTQTDSNHLNHIYVLKTSVFFFNSFPYLFWKKRSTFSRNSSTEWLNHDISLLELLIFIECKPVRRNGRVFFIRLENDPVDVDLSTSGISRAGVSRYLTSSLLQVLPSQGARNNRRYDYHLYIADTEWYNYLFWPK